MIEYKNLTINHTQIKELYLDNKWYSYTNDFDHLLEGIVQSTDKIGAYDNGCLVGLIRTVSDLNTICYIQDILVKDSHKSKGIGTHLIKMVIDKYPHIRQIVLMTDAYDERSNSFYKKIGMVPYIEKNCMGYILKK